MVYVRDNQEQLVLQTEYLEIKLDAKHHMLSTDWSGWLDFKKGQTGCLQILEHVRNQNVTKILNNNSKVTGHSGATSWMSEVWLPALREAGITHFAWVYSHEFFTQLEIDNTVDRTTGIAMRTFFLPEDARQWLLAH